MIINPGRPVEELTGDNLGIVRQKLGRIHVTTTILDAARECHVKDRRSYPVALRRGLIKAIIDTMSEYRELYVNIMSANSSHKKQLGAFD